MDYLVSLLLAMSDLIGVQKVPQQDSAWKIVQQWTKQSTGLTTAIFKVNGKDLGCQKDTSIEFPQIIHGAHEIYVNGQLVDNFNDPKMSYVRSFYGRPIVDCARLDGKEITWKIISNTAYFAHFSEWPKAVSSKHSSKLYDESANIAAFGALFLLALYLINGITKNVLVELNVTLAMIALFSAFYFFMTVAGLMNANISMLSAHRFADFCILLGTVGVVKYLSYRKLIPNFLARAHYIIIVIAELFVIMAKSGDEVQVGTSLAFVIMPVALVLGVFNEFRNMWGKKTKVQDVFDLAGLALFGGSIINDVLCIVGVFNHQIILPLGFVGGTYSFATAVHSWTAQIYNDREYLNKNLQKEVTLQTAEIEQKRQQLEDNLNKLKIAQAELIQSAKLASLGTLAAGIAHEINNSINYVSNSLPPLDKMINDLPDQERKTKIKKLLNVMKEGTDWTVNIVKSLRLYTGLNQAEFKDVKILEIVDAVLSILSSKIRGKIEVTVNVPQDLTFFGSTVGINQVIMNLVTNAIDAMNGSGKLDISANENGQNIAIKIHDSGPGIPSEIKAKIFDPFFTTKAVGSGTGLGLHIVSQEVHRHSGTVDVESSPGQGATFIVTLPKHGKSERMAA